MSAAELTSMRATVGTSLADTCSIVTRTLSSDGAGGHTESTSSTTVACRISPDGGGQEDTIGGRVTPVSRWVITVPYSATVAQSSKITFGSRTFEVVSVDVDRTWDLCKRVRCVEVL